MKRFRYKPLEWQDEIRLLWIIDIDGNDEDPIHSELFQPNPSTESWSSVRGTTNQVQDQDVQDHVDLKLLKVELVHMLSADPKSYTALSYAWGDSTVTKGVIINNSKSRIAASLHSALFNLHVGVLVGKEESTYIWSDAICINPKDNEEKAHQVQQMKRIYENATEVIVWLGTGNWWRYLGLEELERVGKACQMGYAWGADPHAVTATGLKKLFELLNEGWNLNKERALKEIFECSWFGRAWVQQEVAVASSVTVVGGRRWISFERLAAAVNAYALLSGAVRFQVDSHSTWFGAGHFLLRQAICYDTMRNGAPFNTERLETVQCTLANRLLYQDLKQKKKLMDHLLDNDLGSFGQLHASDWRDLVYAFLGISIDTERLNIEPRYDLEWPAVSTDVTYKLIRKEGSGILTLRGRRGGEFPPLWVLDIGSLPMHASINKRICQMNIFNASLNIDFFCERDDSSHVPTLEIDGVVVDTIKEVGGDISGEGNITTIPFFNQIRKFLAKGSIYTAQDKMITLQRYQQMTWSVVEKRSTRKSQVLALLDKGSIGQLF